VVRADSKGNAVRVKWKAGMPELIQKLPFLNATATFALLVDVTNNFAPARRDSIGYHCAMATTPPNDPPFRHCVLGTAALLRFSLGRSIHTSRQSTWS
jgi:hypothetical protein